MLVCTNLKHGYAYLPGGHIEFGESAAEALAREFVEECGLRVRVGDLALVTEGSFATKKRWHHEVNLVFHVEHVGGRGARNSDDAGRSGADADHGSSPREATGSAPHRVVSLEDSIGFEWVDLAAVPDLDIRPASAKAWLAALGHQDGASVEWVSELAARPLGNA